MKSDEQLANEIINARDGRDHPAGFVRAGHRAVLEEVKERNGDCLAFDREGCAAAEVDEKCDYCWAIAKLRELEGGDA